MVFNNTTIRQDLTHALTNCTISDFLTHHLQLVAHTITSPNCGSLPGGAAHPQEVTIQAARRVSNELAPIHKVATIRKTVSDMPSTSCIAIGYCNRAEYKYVRWTIVSRTQLTS
jgi:hypothetical protein